MGKTLEGLFESSSVVELVSHHVTGQTLGLTEELMSDTWYSCSFLNYCASVASHHLEPPKCSSGAADLNLAPY